MCALSAPAILVIAVDFFGFLTHLLRLLFDAELRMCCLSETATGANTALHILASLCSPALLTKKAVPPPPPGLRDIMRHALVLASSSVPTGQCPPAVGVYSRSHGSYTLLPMGLQSHIFLALVTRVSVRKKMVMMSQ